MRRLSWFLAGIVALSGAGGCHKSQTVGLRTESFSGPLFDGDKNRAVVMWIWDEHGQPVYGIARYGVDPKIGVDQSQTTGISLNIVVDKMRLSPPPAADGRVYIVTKDLSWVRSSATVASLRSWHEKSSVPQGPPWSEGFSAELQANAWSKASP
jgi:hypothetical protein